MKQSRRYQEDESWRAKIEQSRRYQEAELRRALNEKIKQDILAVIPDAKFIFNGSTSFQVEMGGTLHDVESWVENKQLSLTLELTLVVNGEEFLAIREILERRTNGK